jgi:hypothetical protein
MFFLFLLLFSYYLLCEFDFDEYNLNKRLYNKNTLSDYVLTVWVACFLIEEFKEVNIIVIFIIKYEFKI